MCEDNRNLEEILAHGAIGVLGINYDQLNAWARSHFNLTDSPLLTGPTSPPSRGLPKWVIGSGWAVGRCRIAT
jgi:hypothetical protein